jgi:hypothetical protein
VSIHLFSTHRLEVELAAKQVTAREQALYIALSSCAWAVANYFYVFPPRLSEDHFSWWLPLFEGILLIVIHITGVMFCLRNCRTDPKNNFAILVLLWVGKGGDCAASHVSCILALSFGLHFSARNGLRFLQ